VVLVTDIEWHNGSETGTRHPYSSITPAPPTLPEVDAAILLPNGDVRTLPEVSTLVRALADAHQDHWHFRVYAPAESRAEVAKAAPKAVAIEKSLDEFH
jgi:HD superfamily phosphohydrolase